MNLLCQKDDKSGKFTLAFVGDCNETSNTVIKLTYNWDTKSYDK
jgi:lactoylglutathione lyase